MKILGQSYENPTKMLGKSYTPGTSQSALINIDSLALVIISVPDHVQTSGMARPCLLQC